jgi:hypothetical protein
VFDFVKEKDFYLKYYFFYKKSLFPKILLDLKELSKNGFFESSFKVEKFIEF